MRDESRASLLAKLHIAKKDLGLTDDIYRDMLEGVTGKRSGADLSVKELVAVIAELRAKGWQPKSTPRYGRKPKVRGAAKPQLAKVEALLADNGRPWAYAEGIAKRMYGVEKLEWCDETQISGVMVALVKDARRRKGKA